MSSRLPFTDDRTLDRRAFLLGAAASLAPGRDRLLIDTHLEVWTHDPRFPFHHPERPALKPREAAPIENQVRQMADFGIKYAVLINPRYYGWDNSYISDCLRRYPKLFVAHGLIDPRGPSCTGTAPLLGPATPLPGHAVQPAVSSRFDVAERSGV